MPLLDSRNPANGELLAQIPLTEIDTLPHLFEQARQAQKTWAARSLRYRSAYLLQLKEVIIDHVDDLIDLISKENGKPRTEALATEILPAVANLSYFSKKAPLFLKDRTLPLTLLKHRRSTLNYWPHGVIAVYSPWNYPFLLPLSTIAMALVSGNAILFKPSEVTPQIGLKIQTLCEQAGLPRYLIQTLIGDKTLGEAIIDQRPSKIFFTGSTQTGRKVMSKAAQHLIPVQLELGGKDAMIVLADADLDFATSAALWGGYSNSGQMCASTERLFVHESIAPAFTELLKAKIQTLHQGPSTEIKNDLGPITYPQQTEVYVSQLQEARAEKANILVGGELTPDRRFLQPTLITGPNLEPLKVQQEETFGPIVTLTPFQSIADAIEKTNQSSYGLAASVITRNLSLGEDIAKQLEVGTVTINEVAYTAGLGETPWGGVKASGFGRTLSEQGLLEFVQTRHIHKPKSPSFTFKSPWWFPYTTHQFALFRSFLALYRRSRLTRMKAVPMFLWNLVRMLKTENRT